jgi:membrane associated rhomboid family serine protease
MLIPIRHQGMTARRWPIITFCLIALNVICFLFTYPSIEGDAPRLGEVKAHIILIAATHPELTLKPEAQQLVDDFKQRDPAMWAQAQKPNRDLEDGWDAQMRLRDDPEKLQEDLDSLTIRYRQLRESSLTEQYAFIPAHPRPITYVSANFLHGGWLHLIGNMWFLWLAGFVLEDAWGRPVYSVFYLLAGAAALQFHAWTHAGSLVPTLGASGAVAALMGAFLVRFPKMKIEMVWLFGFFRSWRFKAPAFTLLPLWLLMEVFYGALFGNSSSVAHWAHVGGFVFGALAALGVRYSGLEQNANQQIEADLTLVSDPEIQQASDFIDRNQFVPATEILTEYLTTHPDSIDARNLLLHAYRATNQQSARIGIIEELCAIHLKAGELDLAWRAYEEFLSSGGKALSAGLWCDLCRAAEKLQSFDRAVAEYERLAHTYPTDRLSIVAQIAAGRLCLKHHRPQRALDFFSAADQSPVPHLDWEQSIVTGMKEAKSAQGQNAAAATASSQR